MTDRNAELDEALDRVFEAARAHLAAVKAAEGRIDDDDVWQAYVDLNNASFAYDERLLDAFGEVTPWDVEAIDPDEADQRFGLGVGGLEGGAEDAHPQVISVRQRRDYRVPSVSALLRLAESARRAAPHAENEPVQPVESVGEAVLELMQLGDGSLGALDIPELEPLNGLVVVAQVGTELDPEEHDDPEAVDAFRLGRDDKVLDRLDEHATLDLDPELDPQDEQSRA